jgi:O-antigen/teichoic acid export membrane protein
MGALLAILLFGITLPLTSSNSITKLYIFIILLGLIFQSFEVIDFYFQAKVLVKFVSICKTTQLVISSIIKIYLISTNADLIWFVWIILFDSITLAIALSLAYIHNEIRIPPFKYFKTTTAKTLLNESWPLLILGIIVSIYMSIDNVMIINLANQHEAGIYASALKVNQTWSFIPLIIVTSLFPALLTSKKSNSIAYHDYLQRTYAFMFLGGLTTSVFLTVFSEKIIVLLYGIKYLEAAPILIILAWSNIFTFIGSISEKWFLIENLQNHVLLHLIVGIFSKVILNVILIPIYGAKGAAISYLIAYIITIYIANLMSRKTVPNFIKITYSINPKYVFI